MTRSDDAGSRQGAKGTGKGPDPEETEPIGAEQRWRLVLGADAQGHRTSLNRWQTGMDQALHTLYDADARRALQSRRGGLGGSSPRVARWLGDIRTYFPTRVVQAMQVDALERFGLTSMLLEPEVLETVEPDIHLAATLASLSKTVPEQSKATARAVVAKVARQVEERLADSLQQAVRGALDRSTRTSRPALADVNWDRTIMANLKNYVPELGTVIPERVIGYGRRRRGFQREIVICLDQSGSMATSVVYASILAAVMSTIRSLRTTLVAYDTAVTDLTPLLTDPVDVIFGTQLGGGTDTVPALEYCQQTITRPADSILILISDLYDAHPERMLERLAQVEASGTQVVVLLALSDDGAPFYNHGAATRLAQMGIPAFGCTPDAFPELLAAAIQRDDLAHWADEQAAQP